jgi:homeobox protein cut-like
LNALSDINLSELQKTLDAQGIELVDNQKESVVGRKALADKTKGQTQKFRVVRTIYLFEVTDFKKISDEGKLSAWKGLLKGTYPVLRSVELGGSSLRM